MEEGHVLMENGRSPQLSRDVQIKLAAMNELVSRSQKRKNLSLGLAGISAILALVSFTINSLLISTTMLVVLIVLLGLVIWNFLASKKEFRVIMRLKESLGREGESPE